MKFDLLEDFLAFLFCTHDRKEHEDSTDEEMGEDLAESEETEDEE